MSHKRKRQANKSKRQLLANELVAKNVIANNNGLTSDTFNAKYAFSVMNSKPCIFFLNSASAHKQIFSNN